MKILTVVIFCLIPRFILAEEIQIKTAIPVIANKEMLAEILVRQTPNQKISGYNYAIIKSGTKPFFVTISKNRKDSDNFSVRCYSRVESVKGYRIMEASLSKELGVLLLKKIFNALDDVAYPENYSKISPFSIKSASEITVSYKKVVKSGLVLSNSPSRNNMASKFTFQGNVEVLQKFELLFRRFAFIKKTELYEAVILAELRDFLEEKGRATQPKPRDKPRVNNGEKANE